MAFVHALALFLFALPSSFISLWMFGKHGLLKEKPSRSQGPAGHVWCDLTCVCPLSMNLPNTVRVSCASHRVLYATHPRKPNTLRLYKKYGIFETAHIGRNFSNDRSRFRCVLLHITVNTTTLENAYSFTALCF